MTSLPAAHHRRGFRLDKAPDRPFLAETTTLRVRFQEVDAMKIVWHGHYVGYFEEARRAFGRRYGLDYSLFFEQGVGAPVVEMYVKYLQPARMSDVLEVTARFYRNEAPKLEFDYELRRSGEAPVLAIGGSVQVLTNLQGELLLQPPEFLAACYQRWEGLWRTH
jgi:acyl-CoA thioester hydrolase